MNSKLLNQKAKYSKVQVKCSKFEFREDIHCKTQPGPVAKNATPSSIPKPEVLELHFSQLVPVES